MTGKTTTDRLKEAFGAYAFVATFGVDATENGPLSGYAYDCGLDIEKFFNKLYVSRPDDEKRIRRIIESNAMSTWLIGSVGVGKTTIAYKVLRAYSQEYDLPFIVVDFKAHDCHEHDPELLDRWLRNMLEKEIYRFVNDSALTAFDMAMIFLADDNVTALTPGEATRIASQIRDRWKIAQRGTEVGLVDWLASVGSPSSNDHDPRVVDLMLELGQHLSITEKLYAITEFNRLRNDKPRRRVVVLFDNLDSVEDIRVREGIKHWMSTESQTLSSAVLFLMCLRPENEDAFLPRNVIGDAESGADEPPLFGEFASVAMKLSLDPGEVASETIEEFARLERGRFIDEEDIADDEFADSEVLRNREAFDDRIHQLRLNFLASLAEGKQIPGVDPQDVRTVANACHEIRQIKSVNRDAQMLANGNRRDMLASIANFVEYVVEDLRLDWNRLGGTGGDRNNAIRRRAAIKSLYYRWLGSQSVVASMPSVYDVTLFNPVAWVDEGGWQEDGDGRYFFNPDLDSVNPQFMEMLLPQFVLTAIYNACGNSLEYRWRSKAKLQLVCDRCKMLGFSEQHVTEYVTSLIQGRQVRHSGFVEITRFRQIHSGKSSAKPSDMVLITDRASRLLEQTGVMFNFVSQLLQHNVGFDESTDRDHLHFERGVVTPEMASDVLLWIRRAITTEIRVLEYVRHQWRGNGDWLQTYQNRFCVNRSHSEGFFTLNSHRLVRSSIGYMRMAVKACADRRSKTKLIGIHEELVDLDKYIRKTVVRHIRNENWNLIPRDRPAGIR